ncbi:hypothetical protein CFFPNG_00712 [Methylorubrum aminovorans]
MVPSIRAAGANIKIGLGLHTRPRSQSVDPIYEAYRWPNLRALSAYVYGSGDANLSLVPFWQHMDENAPYTMSQVGAVNGVGLSRSFISDDIHFFEEQRHVVAERARGWIAKHLTGGTAYAPNYLIEG